MARQKRNQTGLSATAFTLVELVVGLVIASMVMAALASFSLGVAGHWNQMGSGPVSMNASAGGGGAATVQSLYLSRRAVTGRLQDLLRQAKQTGLVRQGSLDGSAAQPAAIMLRTSASSSAQLQTNEVALIEHDASDRTIKLYRLKPSVAPQALSNTALTNADAPERLKEWGANLDVIVLAHDVAGARFAVAGGGGTSPRPMFEFLLAFRRGAQAATEYGAATVRAPLPSANVY